MTDEQATRLHEAIASDQLAVLCGAGLSRSPPSALPTAAEVASLCAAKYQDQTGRALPLDAQADVEKMAKHFRDVKRLDYFIDNLVPWPRFKGIPNCGHDAVADFLSCRVFLAGVTTNFDALIEVAAENLGEPDFRAIVDMTDLPQSRPHTPLLKIHGCGVRSRSITIWCSDQLTDPGISDKMIHFRDWLAAHLLGRDLLFVGFWSDWAYLTELFSANLAMITPRHVYLVDTGAPDFLQAKAPRLWSWAHSPGIVFHHIQESGAEFLDDLRRRWSRLFLAQLLAAADSTYTGLFGTSPISPPPAHGSLDSKTLYALRRDLSGTPRTAPVREKTPQATDHVAASIHRRLLEAGATYLEHTHLFAGRRIRLISGRGRVLSKVKADFGHEGPTTGIDSVICAGALPDFAPGDIVRGDDRATIVRAGLDHWRTQEDIVAELRVTHG